MLDRRGDGAVNDDYRLHAGLTKLHRVQTLVPREVIAAELLANGAVKADGRDDLEAPIRVIARGNFGGSSVAGQIVHFTTVDVLDGWQVGLLDFAKLSDLPRHVLVFLEDHANDAAKAQLLGQARGEAPPPLPVEPPPAVAPVTPVPGPSEVPTPSGESSTPPVAGAVPPPQSQLGQDGTPAAGGPVVPPAAPPSSSSTPASTPPVDVVPTPTSSPEPVTVVAPDPRVVVTEVVNAATAASTPIGGPVEPGSTPDATAAAEVKP